MSYKLNGAENTRQLSKKSFIIQPNEAYFCKSERDNPAGCIASGRYSAASSPVHHG
jgi:hypothetical protein